MTIIVIKYMFASNIISKLIYETKFVTEKKNP